jgi:hypothetical protein
MITKFNKIFIISILPLKIFGQQIDVYAPNEVAQNETFEVKYEVKNVDDISGLVVGSFLPLQVVSGPMRSSSISIINGVKSSSFSLSYRLISREAGSFFIPSSSMTIRSKKLTSPVKKILVKVEKKTDRDAQSKDLFIKAELLPSRDIYLGEQAILRYELYYKGDVSLGDALSGPDLSNFSIKHQSFQNMARTVKVLNGVEYNTAYFGTQAIFPQKIGGHTLLPLEKIVGVATGEIDEEFGFFSRKEYKQINLRSNSSSIKVLPLPAATPGFTNAVGQYTMVSALEKRQNGYFIVMTINGNGDPNSLKIPNLESNSDFEVFAGSKVSEEDEFENQYIHQTVYEYPVVPKRNGQLKYVAKYNFFDPEQKKYIDLEQNNEIVADGLPQQKAENKVNYSSENNTAIPSWVAGIIGALIASSLGYFLLLIYNRHKNKSEPPKKIESQNSINIEKLKSSPDVFAESKKMILSHLNSKYGIEPKDQNRSYIQNHLTKLGETQKAEKVEMILERCERSIYGGVKSDQDKDELIRLVQEIIR